MSAGAAITSGAPVCTPRSAESHLVSSVAFQAPERSKSSMFHIASSGAGPRNAEAALFEPSCVAWNGDSVSRRPSTRSSQPVRSDVPGAARSISSIAEKCDRFGASMPTACTMPSVPASYSGFSGAIAGCRPKFASSGSSWPWGTAMFGRHAA